MAKPNKQSDPAALNSAPVPLASTSPFEQREGFLLLHLRAVPKAGRDEVGEVRAGRLVVRVTAAPEDGKANAAIVKLLAKHWHIAAGSIEVVSGHSARDKTLRIDGVELDALLPA